MSPAYTRNDMPVLHDGLRQATERFIERGNSNAMDKLQRIVRLLECGCREVIVVD